MGGGWEAGASEPVHIAPAPDTHAGACRLRPRGQVGVQTGGLEGRSGPSRAELQRVETADPRATADWFQ